MTTSPFKNQFGSEVLIDAVTGKSPVDLVIALFSIALCFGIDRTEAAIKATYGQKEASQIISGMNVALSHMK